ncbi:hypothetical protein HUG15_05745 [Salicibibacter cibarius]|uniref:Uncharacterized protein n=1 Tax=Salicibibacter cibarius TaxID=2743000 RepID=A0A7T6Z1Q9_9BACI|nr:hypothetical protein [Salicibibacter cibarius]QQK75096.1 hypothetical protein HUG15_05410 [Salicibibacter cibarius]QQK75157.1 hypothetical protein HUG15_05745 [Salicibibacter cibarius]
MAKNTTKPVRVELDGEEKLLRFDFNAMADFEDVMGYGLFAAVQEGQIGFRTIRAFYWAGLKWKEKGLTIDRTGQILGKELNNGTDLQDLMSPIEKALTNSGIIPDQDEEEDVSEEDEGKNG